LKWPSGRKWATKWETNVRVHETGSVEEEKATRGARGKLSLSAKETGRKAIRQRIKPSM